MEAHMADWIDVARVDDLPEGERKVVATEAGKIAVFHLADGFYAIEDICTHDGGELASGSLEGDEIICPRHGARFCIRNGRVLTPPAYEDVETFPTRIEGGWVQIEIDV
jgi:3-phenylpropionate/trans-cinnamate dioxygenase ferredoxin subunit